MLDHDIDFDNESWPPPNADETKGRKAFQTVFKRTIDVMKRHMPEHAELLEGLTVKNLMLEFVDVDGSEETLDILHGASLTHEGTDKFILLKPALSEEILNNLDPTLSIELARDMVWAYIADVATESVKQDGESDNEHADEDEVEDDESGEMDFSASLGELAAWENHVEREESEDDDERESDVEAGKDDTHEGMEGIVVEVMDEEEFDSACERVALESADLRKLYTSIVRGQVRYTE